MIDKMSKRSPETNEFNDQQVIHTQGDPWTVMVILSVAASRQRKSSISSASVTASIIWRYTILEQVWNEELATY